MCQGKGGRCYEIKKSSEFIDVRVSAGRRKLCIEFASDADTSETATIRVYDKNTADIRMANNDRILLDTWTVSISADGSVKEVNAK